MLLQNSTVIIKGYSSTEFSHYKDGFDGDDRSRPFPNDIGSVWLPQRKDTAERSSTIWVKLDSRDFRELARLMFKADKKAATKAFAQALNATA